MGFRSCPNLQVCHITSSEDGNCNEKYKVEKEVGNIGQGERAMMERGSGKFGELEAEGVLMCLLGTPISPEKHFVLPQGYGGSVKLSHLPQDASWGQDAWASWISLSL